MAPASANGFLCKLTRTVSGELRPVPDCVPEEAIVDPGWIERELDTCSACGDYQTPDGRNHGMPETQDWNVLIENAATARPEPINARHRLETPYPSCSRPVLMDCSDNNAYVVKWFSRPRMIANDQIVGILGNIIGAPIPEVRLVNIPSLLRDADPELKHMQPGVCHGSKFIRDVSDSRESFRFAY